jgi:DNA-binding response OmpR family regulator
MKALVFEDNGRIIELYKKIFAQKNYEADFVSDASSCLAKFEVQAQNYDLVILEKPVKIDGDANLEDKIRKSSPQQKIFFLSPYMSPRGKEFDRIKDTTDLIDKPFALISLLSYLEIKPAIAQRI